MTRKAQRMFSAPRHKFAHALSLLGTLSATVFLSLPAQAEGVRAKVEKWAEAGQVASKEASEWRIEKEMLRATRDLLKRERDALKAEIAELETSSTGASEERQELVLRGEAFDKKSAVLGERIASLESQVLSLVDSFPAPLVDKLEPLLIQIPEDPSNTRAPQSARLMNVLGILSQAEKFNSTATFVAETRAVGGGDQKVSVRTLYWGLSQAVYVDAEGNVAGFGRPTDKGWTFQDDPQVVAQAARLLDIYEGNTDDIEFINFPVELR